MSANSLIKKLIIFLVSMSVVSTVALGVIQLIQGNQTIIVPDYTKKFSDSSIIKIEFNNYIINAEAAVSSTKRSQGLMYKEYLPENEGMFFIFEESSVKSFWMKNTTISLDIIFLDSNLTVTDVYSNTEPLRESPLYSSSSPSQYVLETNSGWAQKVNLKVGDSLNIL